MNKNKVFHRINDGIRAPQIRIVGDGIESKVCSIQEAMKIAEPLDVDVVEINPNSNPPVCKLIRYDKFLYEEKRKVKEIEKKNREQRVDIKEIGLGPNTDTHDIDFKVKHAINFLNDGDKVKLVMKFSGREMVFKDRGQKLMLEFIQKLENYGVAESLPKMEGKRMFVTIRQKKGT
jgi:translation initiation factor IF-3